MPKSINQRNSKFRCLEAQCSGAIILDSKWSQHVQSVHPTCNPSEIKYMKFSPTNSWPMMSGTDTWNNSFLSTNVEQSEIDDQESSTSHSSPPNNHEDSVNKSSILNDLCGENESPTMNNDNNMSDLRSDILYSSASQMEMKQSPNHSPVLSTTIKSEIKQNLESNDPYILTNQKITPVIINLQLKLGPMQPSPAEYQYPKTHRPTSDSLLCFNPTWFERKLADGSTQPRPWLSYSKYLNKAFCIYCILFGNSAKVSESWTKTGWDTWNNGSRDIKRHEESPQHRAAELAKVKAMSGFHSQHNSLFQVTANSEVIENRKMVKAVIDFIKLSASIQVDGERLSQSFTKIIQMIGQYDGSLGLAIEKLRSMSDQELNFVSVLNQQRLASAISETVAERLIMLVKKRRSYTLVVDVVSPHGTGNKSVFRVALWIRYLSGDSVCETKVTQSLLDVMSLTSGENLEERVFRVLRKYNLDPSNMVTFCCHSPYSETYLEKLGALRVWPQNEEILAFILESGCTSCPRLSACLGLVQQLASFWAGSSARDRFLCDFLDRVPGSVPTSKIDDMLDLLVDRYAEMIDALAELNATSKLTPLEMWTSDSLWKGLKAAETEEGVQILRKVIGILRPAFSCQQLGRVHFLHQMRNRLHTDLKLFETNMENGNNTSELNGSPPNKIFRREIGSSRSIIPQDEYITFMRNVNRIVSETYSDTYLQFVSEIIHFSGNSLDDCSYSATPLNEHSISTVCLMAKVDSRSVVREILDFQPIYREHKAAVIDFPSSANANTTVFPGHHSSPTKTAPVVSDPFLTPLKLVTEFTSFPSLLTVYKMLAVLPIFTKPSWQTQRQRVQRCLKFSQNLDEFSHCSLMLASIEDQNDDSVYLPVDMVIDKFAAYSATLRKALSLPR